MWEKRQIFFTEKFQIIYTDIPLSRGPRLILILLLFTLRVDYT